MTNPRIDAHISKPVYHKPIFHSYGNISVLTASASSGGSCDSNAPAGALPPGCGGNNRTA